MAEPQSNTQKLTVQQAVELYNAARNQLQATQQQLATLNSYLQEVVNAVTAAQELESVPGKEPVLFSLGSGVFAKALPQSSEKLLINLGYNVYQSVTLQELQAKMETRKKELLESIAEMQVQHQALLRDIQELEHVLRSVPKNKPNALHDTSTTPSVS